MHSVLVSKMSAQAAWNQFDRVQHQAKAVTLCGSRTLADGVRNSRTSPSRMDYGERISNLSASLRSVGTRWMMGKSCVSSCQFCPTRFSQMAFSIEALLNLATLTVEEMTGHL
jgi:hypothetical protein